MRLRLVFALCWAVLSLVGCGRQEGNPIVPAEVTVLMDDKPVEGASVTFVISVAPQPATGLTNAQGKYKMSALRPNGGAAIAMNLVSVLTRDIDKSKKAAPETGDQDSGEYNPSIEGAPPPVVKYLVPQKYGLIMTSGLTAEVEKGSNKFEFKLDSKAK